jgi:hypothetical protein
LNLKWMTLLALFAAAAGCRAGVDGGDMTVPDMGDDSEGGTPPDMLVDLFGADLLCTTVEPENCSNNCDDDKNGYMDDDDPVCTHQVVVTTMGSSVRVRRLILDGTPRLLDLDGNVFPGNGSATFVRAFSPAIYLASDSGRIQRIQVPDGGSGAFTTYYTLANGWPPGAPRDACIFNGELLILERNPSVMASKLHRFNADIMMDKGTVTLPAGFPTACSTDGDRLYVAIYDPLGGPSRFHVFDKTLTLTGSPIDIPPSLAAAGYDRVIGFAWSKKDQSFFGLFVKAMGSTDDTKLNATQIHPFGFDGGVGTPIDSPMDAGLHGIGTFLP